MSNFTQIRLFSASFNNFNKNSNKHKVVSITSQVHNEIHKYGLNNKYKKTIFYP